MSSPLFDLYDPYGRLKSQYDSGLLTDEEGQRRKPRVEDLLSEEEKSSLLGTLANAGTSGLAAAGYALDYLGSGVRGLLAGQPTSVFGTSDERVSGRDLLRAYGLIGDEDNWGNFAAGLATEIVTDPLTYLNPFSLLGRGAASMAGRAASRAGLLDNAALIARKKGMGLREYMTSTTGRQLVADSADPEAFTKFSNAAKGKGLDTDELLNMPLGGAMEFRVPGFERGSLVNLPGTKTAARWLDTFGRNLEENPITGAVINRMTRAFDPTVLGRLDPEDQWRAREAVAQYDKFAGDVRQNAARVYADARRAGDDFDSAAIQNAIRDTIEANGDPEVLAKLQDQASVARIEAIPEYKAYRDWYRDTLAEAQERRAALGLETPNMQSLYGTGYIPRQAVRFDVEMPVDQIPGRVPRRQAAYNRGAAVYATDDLVGRGRNPYLDLERPSETLRRLMAGDSGAQLRDRLFGATPEQMPGIIDEAFKALGLESPYSRVTSTRENFSGQTADSLRAYLADPTLVLADRKAGTAALVDVLKTQQGYKQQLGDLLRGADKQFAQKGVGLFDRHTMTDMLRYGVGGARGEANASVLLDSLVKHASDLPAGQMPGGGSTNLLQAAEGLGFSKSRLKEILATRMPGRDIDNLSLPDTALAEMKAVSDVPSESDSLAGGLYKSFTNLFKVGALANPSYHSRNLVSGYLSTLMAGGSNPVGLGRSMAAGYGVGKGNYDAAYELLKDAPRYQGFSKEEVIASLQEDLARGRLGQGLAMEGAVDPGTAAPALVPGLDTQPKGGLGYWASRIYDPNRTLSDYLGVRGVGFRDAFSGRRARGSTTNPLLELHEQTGRRVEDALRIGTFIDALRQGYSPDAAAKRVFKTQVDYSPEAFTQFERKLKNIVPFYSYPRGIAPSVAENMLYRPGGLQGQSIRAVTAGSRPSEENFTPEYLRESAAIPIPGGPEELQRYLIFRALPYADLLNYLSIGQGNTTPQAIADTAKKTTLNLLGSLNPLIKYPLESATGRQFHSGRELSDTYSVLERDIGPIGRQIENIGYNLPGGSQAIGMYRTLTDDRLTPSQKAAKLFVNKFLGATISDNDPDKTRRRAARETLEDLLTQSPEVQTYESLSVPEEDLTSMPLDQQKLYLLYRVLQSEAARKARERKKAETLLMGSPV